MDFGNHLELSGEAKMHRTLGTEMLWMLMPLSKELRSSSLAMNLSEM